MVSLVPALPVPASETVSRDAPESELASSSRLRCGGGQPSHVTLVRAFAREVAVSCAVMYPVYQPPQASLIPLASCCLGRWDLTMRELPGGVGSVPCRGRATAPLVPEPPAAVVEQNETGAGRDMAPGAAASRGFRPDRCARAAAFEAVLRGGESIGYVAASTVPDPAARANGGRAGASFWSRGGRRTGAAAGREAIVEARDRHDDLRCLLRWSVVS